MGQIADMIRRTLESWPGVHSESHRFGGTEFRLGRRELGHLHGDGWADLPFSKAIRRELVAQGHAEPHHILPDSGWVTKRIRSEADLTAAIELFRLNYERHNRTVGHPTRPPSA
jgi:hypothetical protein